ncbi:hypothetical protein NQ314_018756 [Rhamnusium bicolor]|uniref:C2H2-type domain-containing protein n=1 Tax=Rhamnusium bicolor TaxID=1586634 RepID=A0AAV8WR59_9CUCU|nr:hypothetical protein NQ314_018756 [Rhamnusium bicolor]
MCYVCLVKYPTREDLKKHVHTLPEIYYCTSCGGYFDTTHGCSKSKILCAFCEKSLKGVNISKHKCFHIFTKDDLDRLKVSERYDCELCGSEILKKEIVSHRRICTSQIKVPEKRSTMCKICNIVFKKYNEYRRHKTIEHSVPKKRIYNCKPCIIKFETRSEYRKHRYQVHDEKYQICFMCGKTVMNLNQHVKSVHGNPDEVKCSQCDKTFSCKKHLNRHMLVHSNDFKHKCIHCGKGFKTPFSLRVHKRSHDVVKPFECGVCLKTFTTKQWRNNHIKTHY